MAKMGSRGEVSLLEYLETEMTKPHKLYNLWPKLNAEQQEIVRPFLPGPEPEPEAEESDVDDRLPLKSALKPQWKADEGTVLANGPRPLSKTSDGPTRSILFKGVRRAGDFSVSASFCFASTASSTTCP